MDTDNKYTRKVLNTGNDKKLSYVKVCLTKSGKTLYASSKFKDKAYEAFEEARIFSRKSDASQSKEQPLPEGEEVREWGVLPILIKRCPAFYVTFGRDNLTEEGESLHQYYTKVYALSYNQAVELVKKKYKGNFQFLHREDKFDTSKYPKGELEAIIQ
jgi:hypothetical protein